jgi:hypothetical protein
MSAHDPEADQMSGFPRAEVIKRIRDVFEQATRDYDPESYRPSLETAEAVYDDVIAPTVDALLRTVTGPDLTERGLEIVIAAAHGHAEQKRWLGYPEMLLEARAIDEAADRLSADYQGVVSAIARAHKELSGRDLRQSDVNRAYDTLNAWLINHRGSRR